MQGEQIKELIEKLAGVMGTNAGVQLVFGETRTFDNRAIIPIAKVSYGMGGGLGAGKSKLQVEAPEGEGAGFGGGVTVKPVGYIEVTPIKVEYRPVIDPMSIATAVAAVLGIMAFKGMCRGFLFRKRCPHKK